MFLQMFGFLSQHYSITIPEQFYLKWGRGLFFNAWCYKSSRINGKIIVWAAKTR
jgi:hypothetical protein